MGKFTVEREGARGSGCIEVGSDGAAPSVSSPATHLLSGTISPLSEHKFHFDFNITAAGSTTLIDHFEFDINTAQQR